MEELLRMDSESTYGEATSRRRKRVEDLFEVVDEAFLYKQRRRGSYWSAAAVVLECALALCHYCSVLHWPGDDMRGVYQVLLYTRVDVIAARANMIQSLACFHFTFLVVPLVGVGLRRFVRPRHWVLRRLVSWPVLYFSKLAFVPAIVLHGALVKCLLGDCTPPTEYSDTEAKDLQNPVLQFLSIPAVLAVAGTVVGYNWVVYCIVISERDYSARSHSLPLVSGLVALAVVLILHICVAQGVAVLCAYALLAWKSLADIASTLPYYTLWVNAAKAAVSAGFLWAVLVRILVDLTGNAFASAPLAVIPLLPVSLLVWQYTSLRSAHFKRWRRSTFASSSEVDLVLRQSLRRGFNQPAVAEIMTQAKKSLYSDYLVLWEAAALLALARDPVSAGLRLALTPQRGASAEVAFQRFLLSRQCEQQGDSGRDSLEFLMLLEEAKKADEVLCQLLIQHCNQALSATVSVRKFENLSFQIAREKEHLRQTYRTMLAKYQDQEQVYLLFGSFLTEILGDSSGICYTNRSISRRGERGVICLHASAASLGTVALFNELASSLLSADSRDIRNAAIDQFVPERLRAVLRSAMVRSLVSLDTAEVAAVCRFLQDTDGFLVNVSVVCRLTVWNQVPLFFISTGTHTAAETAVLDSDLNIITHTKGLSPIVVSGQPATALFANITEESLRTGTAEVVLRGRPEQADVREVAVSGLQLYVVQVAARPPVALFSVRSPQPSKGVKFLRPALFTSLEPSHKDHQLPEDPASHPQLTSEKTKSSSTLTPIDPVMQQTRLMDFRISRICRRTRLSLLISYLSVIAVTLVVLFCIESVVDILLNQDSIRAIGRVRYISIEAATAVRLLSLIQSGFLTQPEATYRSMLKSAIDYYRAAMDETLSKIDSWPAGPNKDMHFHSVVPQWLYYDDAPKVEMQSVLTLMEQWMRRAKAVNNSAAVNISSADALYLFRNGPAEDWLYSNHSVFLFLSDERQHRMDDVKLTNALVVLSACLLLVTVGALVGPQVFILEKLNTTLWQHLYSVPKDCTVSLKQRVSDRLEVVHGLELPAVELHRRVKQPTPTPVWPVFAAQLALLIALSGAFYISVFTREYRDTQVRLTTLPNFLNWNQLYHLYFEGSCFWNVEMYLDRYRNMSYATLMRHNQYWSHPQMLLSRFQRDFAFTKSLLRTRNDDLGIATTDFSENYTNFFMSQTCNQVNVTNCNDTALSLGVHYMATEFMQAMADLSAAIQVKTANKSQVFGCESKRKPATAGRRFLNTIFEDEMRSFVRSDMATIKLAVILYVVSLLLLFACVNWLCTGHIATRMKQVTELIRIFGRS